VIQRIVENTSIRFSVSVVPIVSREPLSRYETVVMRVYHDADVVPRIDKLGLDPYSLQTLQSRLAVSRGLIVFAGLLRGGVSATLTGVVHAIMKSAINIVVVQEHVEYIIDGTRQVKLNPRLTMHDALDVILDQDPDVVVLGDLTEQSVATMALKLANTGHLVLARISARNAANGLAHLVETTGSAFHVSETVSAIIAQHPIRTICERCRKPMPDGASRLQALNIQHTAENLALHRPVGCINCHQGYVGKRILYEALNMSPAVRSVLLSQQNRVDQETLEVAAVGDGMVPMRSQAIERLLRGGTSIEEVLQFLR
jgi:type IV pilus assembly protein PilB